MEQCKPPFASAFCCLSIFCLSLVGKSYGQFTINGVKITSNGTYKACVGSNITLQNNVGSSYDFSWVLTGGSPSSSSATSVTTSYSIAGTYKVYHYWSALGNNYSDSIQLLISNIRPVADFNFSPTNQVCGNTTFNFNSSGSSGNSLKYQWNFGDGSSSSVANPQHAFVKAIGNGSTTTYSVILTVTNEEGCSQQKSNNVTVIQVPDLTISTSDEQTVFPSGSDTITFRNCNNKNSHLFSFTNNSTTISTNTDYVINWGDGSPLVSMSSWPKSNPLSHNFLRGLTYVTISVKNPAGCQTIKTFGVFVGSNPSGGFATNGNTTNLCAPSDVEFLINNTANNGNGTRYIFFVSDGSAPVVMQHPPPSTVSHNFDLSSCGFTSIDNTPNAFYATLRIENPCEPPTTLTISPIQVSGKPNPLIVANNNVCTGTNVPISHTGQYGQIAAVSGCTQNGKQVWEISPSTGFTITSGVLGSINGNNTDADSWTNGSTNLNLVFNTAGTYNIRLRMSNSRCGVADTVKTICVRNPPSAQFTPDKNAGCAPLAVKFNNTSAIGGCLGDSYSWAIQYADIGACSTVSGFSFINGTSNTSASPEINFTNPGRYIVTLTVTAKATGCSAATFKDTIVVRSKVNLSLNPIASICQNGTVNPSATVSCFTANATYAWTFTGGNPASSTSLAPGSVSYNSLGSYNISLAATNECGTSTASTPVVVNTVSTADAGPDQSLCGSSVTMAANTPTTGTGAWQKLSGAGGTVTSPGSPTTTITGLSAGTYFYKWTISNGNCSSMDTVKITIAAGPTTSNPGPAQNLCNATQTTMAANTPTVGTGTWSYVSGPTGYTITAPQLPNTTITGLVPGTYVFRWTINYANCSSSNNTVTIINSLSPSVADAGADQNVCTNSVVLAANSPAIGTGVWTKISGPASFTFSAPASPSTTVSNLATGTYVFRWTITNGACPASLDDVQVIVSGTAPKANAGPDQSLCATSTVTLAGNAATPGTGQWTYVSGPAGYQIQNPASPTSNVTGIVPGVYVFKWTISNSVCNPTEDDVQMTVFENASTANAGPAQNKCGVSATMAANTPSVGTGAWTYVKGPPGYQVVNPSSPTTDITGLVPGTYTFRWSITNGTCKSSSDVEIGIAAGPTAANAGPDQQLCLATETNLKGNSPTVGTGEWSIVSGPAGASIAEISNPLSKVSGLVAGTYVFRWTISFSTCTPSSDDVQVTIFDNPDNANAGSDQLICASSTILNANSPVIGTGLWTVLSAPNTPIFSNPSQANSAISNLIPGTYNLKWETKNGPCAPKSATVQVKVSDISTVANAGPDQTVCETSSITLAGNTPANGAGIWTYVSGPAGYNIQSPSSPNATVSYLQPANYVFRWTISNGVCPATSDNVQIRMLPAIVNKLGVSPQTICAGQAATVTGQLPSGGNGNYSYQWQASTDNISFTNLPNETAKDLTVSPNATTWYRRTVNSLPCQSFSDTALVTVLPGITGNSIAPAQEICYHTHAGILGGGNPSGGGGGFGFSWEKTEDGGTTWQQIPGANSSTLDPGILDTTTGFRRIVTTTLCNGPQGVASNTVIIVVRPDAIAMLSPITTIDCAPFLINNATLNPTIAADRNSDYAWFVNGQYLNSGSFGGYTISNAGDSVLIKMVAISKYGCKHDSTALWFYSPKNPVPGFTLSDTIGCGPLNITFTNTTPEIDSYNYTWDFGNGISSNSPQPGTVHFDIHPNFGDTAYTISLKATGGCDTIKQVKYVTVRAKPKALFTPGMVSGCSPMKVQFTNTSRGSNAVFTWDFDDGSAPVTSSDAIIEHIFHTGILDTFFVKLYASNDCGTDTQQYAIVVNPNSIRLNMAINGNQVNGCAPHTVSFVNNTLGANQFRWDFGDGSPIVTTTRGIDTVQHNFLQRGTYTVSVQATNSCSDTSMNIKILVEDKPTVAFTASPGFLCVGQELRFTNNSDAGLAWNWKFGDGTGSSIQQPIKKYTAPGNYRVWLYGTKSYAVGFGCTDSSYADIVVTDTLTGSVKVDSTGSCAPMRIVFKNTTPANGIATWDFGDGTTAIGDSVVHIFNDPGNYAVVMNAKDAGGCNYKLLKNITVNGPTGSLQYAGGIVCPGNANSFSAISNTASSYKFYFGNSDSLFTTQSTVSYTYKVPGTYLPSVILSTAGCDRTIKGADTIFVDALKAGFRFNTTYGCGKTDISFTDTSLAYFGISQWDWSFGDGTYSTAQHPKKTFTSPGNYTVSLKITSKTGCVMIASLLLPVEIKEIPVADFTADSTVCTSHKSLLSAAASSNDPTTIYSWNFGNGLTATGSNVSTYYYSTGSFTVRIIARSQFGCADTAFKSIKVLQSPVINAGPDQRICLGQSTTINAAGGVSYSWSPLQGLSCATCATPLAQPTTTTTYIVTGLNSVGCTNTDTIRVEVIQPLHITVTGNDTLCIGQSSQLFASGADSYRWNPSVGLNSTNIPNPIARPASTTQYRVVGFDAYNCFTDTAYVTVAVGQYPVVDLGSGTLLVAGTSVQLAPSITNGPFKKYTWTPSSNLSCTNCANPIAVINNNITYELKAENIYGCSGTDTISFQVMCSKDDQVYIPNAFSPDGDGINDVYMLYGKGIKVEYFRIYNRWGQVVFDGGSNYLPNLPQYGWDGKVNGKLATQDVYVYVAQVTCSAGGTFTYKGNLSLLILR